MRLPFTSKPKTLADRAKIAADDTVAFARSVPDRLEGSREQAWAVVGAVAGTAAGLAFWRSRKDDRPTVHRDPAQPTAPWKMPPPGEKPSQTAGAPAADVKAAAAEAAGSRSK